MLGERAPDLVAPEWLTLEEAAVELDVTTRTVYRWTNDGRLVGYRLPGHGLRFRRVDVEQIRRYGVPRLPRAKRR